MRLKPVNISTNSVSAWYYEYRGYIEIYIEPNKLTVSPGDIRTVKIPKYKLLASMRRMTAKRT